MTQDSYYHILALPALEGLGSTPPLTPTQLLQHLADYPNGRALVEVLFLFDDLIQREAFLAGEIKDVSPTVLTIEQTRNEAPLPAALASETEEVSSTFRVDRLWDNCFRHAAEIARQRSSTLLASWVGYEVGLRNALATARAKRLGLEERDYRVAEDLASADQDFAPLVDRWTAAATPLAGLCTLIEARWAWLAEHDAWFTFSNDELVAYGARLMLLHQWRRLAEAGQSDLADGETEEPLDALERTTR